MITNSIHFLGKLIVVYFVEGRHGTIAFARIVHCTIRGRGDVLVATT